MDESLDREPSSVLNNLLNAGPQSRLSTGGFHLNYNKEAPVLRIDIGGPDQQLQMAKFITTSIEKESNGWSVKDAMEKLGLQIEEDLLPGLDVRLLRHQVIGVAWMLEKEHSADRGGILADDMGLGKTVQMIATMAMNQPKGDDDVRTTLVVVPAALLQQWKDEIETKTNNLFSVRIHHSKDKLKSTKQVRSMDVIITSYQTLCMDFSVPKSVEDGKQEEWLKKNGGVLARSRFHRVIADEAQFIRNRSTRASICLAIVRAKYRWALTGTPVTNSLADIYGLLRFGHFRPWNDWPSFDAHIAKTQNEDAPLAGSRAQAILKPLLLRRTKNSKLNGEPLLKLPPKEIDIVQLQFTPDEREIYSHIEGISQMKINRFIKDGTLLKNHTFILVMILRLRQLCCHPYLILVQDDDEEEDGETSVQAAATELTRAKTCMGQSWVNEVSLESFLDRALNKTRREDCPNCNDMLLNDNGRLLTCGHQICQDCTMDLSNSPIKHDGIFGEGTEAENLAAEKAYELADARGQRPCPTCQKMLDLKSPKNVFKTFAFEPSAKELAAAVKQREKAKSFVLGKSKSRFSKPIAVERSPSPALSITDSIPEVLDSDDEDLPEPGDMFGVKKEKPKKSKVITSDDEDESDSMDVGNTSKRKASDDEDEDIPTSKRRRSGTVSKSNLFTLAKGKKGQSSEMNAQGPSEAVIANWSRGDADLEPSTKMQALVNYIKEWNSTGDKTICYSQWTSVLDLIEILFSRHGIHNLRFDGSMDRAEREEVLASFRKPDGPKILLISTKAGSVGLNLVSANRVVNMDLSWNYATESQAYDRCHRIGQTKPVFVKRLVVQDTIEERMLRLQDVKIGLAEAALGEGNGQKLHKLSVKDIKFLFGIGPKNTNPPVPNRAGSDDDDDTDDHDDDDEEMDDAF
ncbi:SNF2 family N-terminal domain-containing protein [Panaeolus papilionaceus]|nr:SNF2 family N-terminal domain-containing protein [Panaeolus papilionaceus]